MQYGSVFAPGLFAGKVVVVTGGGSGIGRCTAHELAALGATVALVGRKVEKLQKVAAEIAEAGSNIDNVAIEGEGAYTTMHFTLQVSNRLHLAQVMRGLRRIQEVVKISRVKG